VIVAPALCRVTDNGGSHTCATTADAHVLWTINTLDAELHLTSQSAGTAFTTAQTFSADTGTLSNVRAGPANILAQFDYAYDAIGNLAGRTDSLNSVFELYCYDAPNRLTTSATASTGPATCSATGAGITAKTIAYDQVGNITSKNDVGTYSYPSSGSARPHAISSITGTVNGVTNPSYTYDANGNMTAGAGRTVTHTAFNMAASIIQGATADCLAYDSNHARIKMEVRASTCGGTLSATVYYLNDPVSGAMSEKLVAGGTTTWRDHIRAGGGIVAERSCTGATPCSSGATWAYFVLDHLGSSTVLTDAAGTATEQLSYDAWGRRRNLNGTDNSACSITSATSRGYTGHEMLDSICEINANARIYDPTVARFMSPDPIISNPFNGQAFNRYSYVNNGPLSATDPSGHVYVPPKYNLLPCNTCETHCYRNCVNGPSLLGGEPNVWYSERAWDVVVNPFFEISTVEDTRHFRWQSVAFLSGALGGVGGGGGGSGGLETVQHRIPARIKSLAIRQPWVLHRI
jgi:RHS repeat-associated protein